MWEYDAPNTINRLLSQLDVPSPSDYGLYEKSLCRVGKEDYLNDEVIINKFLNNIPYPNSTFRDIVNKIQGGRTFSVIDLKDEYLQVRMDTDSSKLLKISTHRGFFKYNRLPYGVSSAPAIF
ncbi:hypothetical protein RF11_16494 [Thelohanellus kitauei]|uniref:Reverse transcriptase domain-containing protein n=1 Tax=Thelohanellus kitauei TaxID=669202 RepID=A0A0C2JSP3_THEKT|nr:hypothetical protein RF11_16494 [Thelohanellus kitauei]